MKNTIKRRKNGNIVLNGITYKPYLVGDLPANFGCIEFNDKEGISEWYKDNKAGLTYIMKK